MRNKQFEESEMPFRHSVTNKKNKDKNGLSPPLNKRRRNLPNKQFKIHNFNRDSLRTSLDNPVSPNICKHLLILKHFIILYFNKILS